MKRKKVWLVTGVLSLGFLKPVAQTGAVVQRCCALYASKSIGDDLLRGTPKFAPKFAPSARFFSTPAKAGMARALGDSERNSAGVLAEALAQAERKRLGGGVLGRLDGRFRSRTLADLWKGKAWQISRFFRGESGDLPRVRIDHAFEALKRHDLRKVVSEIGTKRLPTSTQDLRVAAAAFERAGYDGGEVATFLRAQALTEEAKNASALGEVTLVVGGHVLKSRAGLTRPLDTMRVRSSDAQRMIEGGMADLYVEDRLLLAHSEWLLGPRRSMGSLLADTRVVWESFPSSELAGLAPAWLVEDGKTFSRYFAPGFARVRVVPMRILVRSCDANGDGRVTSDEVARCQGGARLCC